MFARAAGAGKGAVCSLLETQLACCYVGVGERAANLRKATHARGHQRPQPTTSCTTTLAYTHALEGDGHMNSCVWPHSALGLTEGVVVKGVNLHGSGGITRDAVGGSRERHESASASRRM